jgi:hypothetical protein
MDPGYKCTYNGQDITKIGVKVQQGQNRRGMPSVDIPGTHTLKYSCSIPLNVANSADAGDDVEGVAAHQIRTVVSVTSRPVITLKPPSILMHIIHAGGDFFNDPGAICHDTDGVDITDAGLSVDVPDTLIAGRN